MNVEHVNVTVANSRDTAELLMRIFDWHIRWEGDSLLGGRTVHVGSDDTYVALYTPPDSPAEAASANRLNGLQHIGVVVDDLGDVESRVRAADIEPYSQMTYEPGSRFYFNDHDGVEYEVVSYTWDGVYN